MKKVYDIVVVGRGVICSSISYNLINDGFDGKILVIEKDLSDEPTGFNFEWGRDYYMNVVWPQAAERVPAFDTARLIRGWAGLYAMNRIDGNAIIGHLGNVQGLYGAVGFSGHGLQQSPAIGKCVSELIQFG